MFLNHEAGGAGDAFGPRLLHPARLSRDAKIPLPFIFGQTHLGSDFHQSNENAIVIERVALAISSKPELRLTMNRLVPQLHCHALAGSEFAAGRHAKESIRAAQAEKRVRLLPSAQNEHSLLQPPTQIMRPIA
jgi:hypothetical protein